MSAICFHNTLSGKSEEYKPLKAGEAKIYTCGPTVYDYAHIGNFRAFVFEDLLRRFLEFSGYKVKHVMNLTDVDDKTIAGAQREKMPLNQFTAKYTQAFNEDLKILNCLAPTKQPAATAEIPAMLDLIGKLIQKGAAYPSGGSVYYKIEKFPGYGKLSKKKLNANIAGASKRVDVDEYDRDQISDFVLWKGAKEGEPSWDSPWGKGRPGWHIECSAMSMKYLGETFDIHAGGEDLIFPHHENEIAQSEGATGKPFVNYWLHCKFLLVNGEKMSKSKGNFFTLRDLLAKGYDPMAIRYQLLSVHYRQTLNFTEAGLKEANEVIRKLDDCYWQCFNYTGDIGIDHNMHIENSEIHLNSTLSQVSKRILTALNDDLNISSALAEMLGGVTQINLALKQQAMDEDNVEAAIHFFESLDQIFGFNIVLKDSVPEDVKDDFIKRQDARLNPSFKENKELQVLSDNLREKIHSKGWLLKDGRPTVDPTTLKKKRRSWDQ